MAAKRGGRRRGRPREEYELYIIEVLKWEYYYEFSSHSQTRYDDAGYHRTETLTFSGRLALPEGLRYQNIVVNLIADKDFTPVAPEGFRAVIGTLYGAGDTLHAHVFVPGDHMAQVVAVAASGRVRVVSFTGTPLKRRSGSIRNVSVSTSAENLWDVDIEI